MNKWLRKIGSRKAMEQRQAERQAGKLNRPRRVWGISKWAKYLRDEGIVIVRRKSDPTLPL